MIALAAILLASAPFGLHAVAWSAYVVLPISAGLSIITVRSAIAFDWRELWLATGRSAFVALTAALPALALAWNIADKSFAEMLVYAVVAIAGAGVGWLAGIYACGHPIKREISRAQSLLLRFVALRKRHDQQTPPQ